MKDTLKIQFGESYDTSEYLTGIILRRLIPDHTIGVLFFGHDIEPFYEAIGKHLRRLAHQERNPSKFFGMYHLCLLNSDSKDSRLNKARNMIDNRPFCAKIIGIYLEPSTIVLSCEQEIASLELYKKTVSDKGLEDEINKQLTLLRTRMEHAKFLSAFPPTISEERVFDMLIAIDAK